MADFPLTPDEIKRLARLVEDNGLSELRYEQGDLRVTLRTASYRPTPAVLTAPAAPAESLDEDSHTDDEDASPQTTESADQVGHIRIEAPIMGVFYRKSSPDAPEFVEIGDTVEVGQVVGMIEAMKVFSEVPSEVTGRVVAVPAKHGGLVQPGDPLVILEAIG